MFRGTAIRRVGEAGVAWGGTAGRYSSGNAGRAAYFLLSAESWSEMADQLPLPPLTRVVGVASCGSGDPDWSDRMIGSNRAVDRLGPHRHPRSSRAVGRVRKTTKCDMVKLTTKLARTATPFAASSGMRSFAFSSRMKLAAMTSVVVLAM
jgi:hypothetical protein